jgi:Holliday junction resolvasome RuvABC endonuclease subunit
MQYFIGCDQSLTSTGIVVLSEGRAVMRRVQPKELRGAARLAHIRKEIVDLATKFPPSMAACEGYSFNSVHRALDLGELGGMVRLAFFDLTVPLVVVAPTTLKKFVTGHGGAKKEGKGGMREGIEAKWGVDIAQDDLADAYGLAQVARVFFTKSSTNRDELEAVKGLTIEPLNP